jgi:hypothetical protein
MVKNIIPYPDYAMHGVIMGQSDLISGDVPSARTMMVTLANGMATTGYIPDDASFGQNVFEVLSSRLKPGYAERGIIDGILNLMEEIE